MGDAIAQVLWMQYFIQNQGYKIGPSIIYQGNKSAIRLETNGKGSMSKCTKHMKEWYFFIKDKVESGEVDLKYCPKEEMWADVLTKPLQWTKYKKFRGKLMNIPTKYDDTKPFKLRDEDRQQVTFAPGTKTEHVRSHKQRANKVTIHNGRHSGLLGCVGEARGKGNHQATCKCTTQYKPYLQLYSKGKQVKETTRK